MRSNVISSRKSKLVHNIVDILDYIYVKMNSNSEMLIKKKPTNLQMIVSEMDEFCHIDSHIPILNNEGSHELQDKLEK